MPNARTRFALGILLVLAAIFASPAAAGGHGFRHAFGVGLLRTQARSLHVLRSGTAEMVRLAKRASEPSLGDRDRELLDDRLQALLVGHDSIIDFTQYEGLTLLDLFGSVTVQQAPGSGQFIDVHTVDVQTATLGIDALDVTTEATAVYSVVELTTAFKALEAELLRNGVEQASLGL